ncbi:30S ribosomal protein S4, partial [Gleimia europaea]|nr:30S ribosomal protein S4 [Gleimia europaea]
MAQSSRRQVRLSRSLGVALTPKAARYFEKRPYGPGQHGRARRRQDSDYAVRLKEKQRLRAQYGLREAQMRRAFEEALRMEGITGSNLVQHLEQRLDALVLRSGFARTIAQARQFVVHRHILVDGKIVDRPSFRVKPGQTIQVKPKSQTTTPFEIAAQGIHRDVLPAVPV